MIAQALAGIVLVIMIGVVAVTAVSVPVVLFRHRLAVFIRDLAGGAVVPAALTRVVFIVVVRVVAVAAVGVPARLLETPRRRRGLCWRRRRLCWRR